MMVFVAERTEPEILDWDSDFWGVAIMRVFDPQVWWNEGDVNCAFLLLDANATDLIHDAERRGFRLMDVRVTLEATQGVARCYGRPVYDEDVDTLAALARRSHKLTRFYADQRFPNERCDDLYETWIRKSIDGWADAVRLVTFAGHPVGYVTVHMDGTDSSLGLIAVDEAARQRGHGHRLVMAALWEAWSRGAERMTVVTQGRNLAAQRMFQRAGFVTSKTELWFHRWTDA